VAAAAIFSAYVPVASRADAGLSGDQRKVLLGLVAKRGKPYHMPASLATALQIDKNDASLPMSQLTMNAQPNAVHTFVSLPDGGVLLGFCDGKNPCRDYRFDVLMSLTNAAIVTGSSASPVSHGAAIGPAEAQMQYWIGVAKKPPK
jgi:hypothetical protein